MLSEAILQKILSEITGLKDEISSFKSEVNSLKVEMNKQLDAIAIKLDNNYNQPGNSAANPTEIKKKIHQLQTDIEFTYQKTALHDLQINRLKNTPTQN